MEAVVLEDNQEYIVIDRIKDKETEYLYLANEKNAKDLCVRKLIDNELLPLENEDEFTKTMLLFSKNNKEIIKDLLQK